MNVFTITILIVSATGVLILMILFGVNFLIRHGLRSKYARFGSDFAVAQNWQELTGTKPEIRTGERQHIFLGIEGYEFDWREDNFDINLPDGRIVVPEVQVVDSLGNIFDTRVGSRFGSTIGLSVLPHGDTQLSSKKEAVVIRIRSQNPFQCRSIGWHTKRMK